MKLYVLIILKLLFWLFWLPPYGKREYLSALISLNVPTQHVVISNPNAVLSYSLVLMTIRLPDDNPPWTGIYDVIAAT